ncbi:beta-lactamase/transpeptidase-like protein [Didymella exigua CBS 183.55]|uniref:Beta-lactamase/transpeptidase-like protein n=1 Tax=Didymella exigua CBS 183.55 TaxID=1150837 RepID=A0A6A5S0Q3_9PLEO|nr:beta-lactamase/transpeptidase-like protein [Didymella exigua CBS 183.55]KAF1931087.1 beta-lactamase/transpeptidase-like protein [Didymella exigua CBS 183.55]
MAKVNGTCDSRFTAVKDLLQANIDAGEELGASLVVNVNGENVVDIWGGYADTAKSKPWEENTITNVWSSSKTVVSLAALLLIDRGLLDPFEKVSKYWPEFGANGKQDVQVRHFLSHSSGVSGWQDPITIPEFCAIESATARLAAQAPWWTPGSASGYHGITMGHLINELIQRITGTSIADFVTTQLATPLAADFRFGVPQSEYARVATIVPPPAPTNWGREATSIDANSIFAQTMRNPRMDAEVANQDFWRQALVPAANGYSNARGIARMLSFVSCGGTVGETQLLRPETVDLIFDEQTNGPDLVISVQTRFGMGFGLSGVADGGAGSWIPEGRICFWGGWGGSMVLCDVGRGVTITYMMNKMHNVGLGSGLAKEYVWEIYRALGVEVPDKPKV